MTVINLQTRRVPSAALLQCSACGAEATASCSCGAPYVPAVARAAEAIARNPGKSDRAIAEEIGVTHPTVAKARKATGNNLPVGKRIGLDGRARRMPIARNKAAEAIERIKARGEQVSREAVVKEAGVANGTADIAIAVKQVEAASEAQQVAAEDQAIASSLSDKGKIKLEDAIRIHKARLDKQFEQRVNDEVRRRIDAADDATRASNKELRMENLNYQRLFQEGGVFTEIQFKQVLMLCHPDNSASPELRAELLQVLIKNKIRLVKE